MSEIEEVKDAQAALLARIEQLEETLAKTMPAVVPVGGVIPFLGTMEEARALRTSGWWICDGLPVDNPASPLHGTALPDLRNRFLRGGDVARTTGGSNAATVPEQTIDSGTYGFGGTPIHQDPRLTVWSSLSWMTGTPIRSTGKFTATTIGIDDPPWVSTIYLCRVV